MNNLRRFWASNMKIMLSALLFIVAVLPFGTNGTVTATPPETPVSIEVASVEGTPGTSVTVAVYMDPGTHLFYDYSMTLDYDSTALQLVSATDDAAAQTFLPDYTITDTVSIQSTGVNDGAFVYEKQKMFTLHFDIKSDAGPGLKAVMASAGTYTYDKDLDPGIIQADNRLGGGITIAVPADTKAPTITQMTSSQSLAADADLEMSFSEDVTVVSGKYINIVETDNPSESIQIEANDSSQITVSHSVYSATINPQHDLKSNTQYYVLMDEGAFTDAVGNAVAGITDNTVWTFKTAAPDAITIGIGNATGSAGQTVNVPVKVVSTTSTGVASFGIQIEYDETALEAEGITGASGDVFDSQINNTEGYLKAAWVDESGGDNLIAAGSNLFTIAFKIRAGAALGDKALTVSIQNDLSHLTFTDVSETELQKTLTPGKVTVKSAVADDDNGSTGPSAPATGADVLVNGKVESAGTLTTEIVGDKSVTTITVDPKKLEDRLVKEDNGAVITIPVNTKSDIVIGSLNGQMVKSMEQKQAIVEIKTDKATYTLPAAQININAISDQIGEAVELSDIQIQIEIAAPSEDRLKIAENASVQNGFTVIAPPLDFTVKALYGDTTLEVSRFNDYVTRIIAIPDGIDPNNITTGIVIEPDGTVRHVPTKVTNIDGKYFAEINSLTNSTYSVVWHPIEFADVANHWAKAAVNDMGSRMVISGIGDDKFNPDADITRAEFAAIVVRGLGLKLESEAAKFTDVPASAWYSDAVNTAASYNLISGYEDGTFRPTVKITREEAMVVIAKAMQVTGLKAELPIQSADITLHVFTDAADVSKWARNSIAESVQAGIVSGRSNTELSPRTFITRAEVASIVQRLLQKSDLI